MTFSRTTPLTAYLEGVAFWSPRLPNWEFARAAIRGERNVDQVEQSRPSPTVLAPTERRRAPDTVALALDVAEQACRNAERSPSELDSVFASTYGDLAINDYMCTTLATAPELISPTKFHHSVHNAAAGYWSIGTGSHTAYTAISAHDCTFATGLLEVVAQVNCGERPVLLIAYDIEARGPLASVIHSRGMFAVALVLSSVAGRSRRSVKLQIQHESLRTSTASRSSVATMVDGSALSNALPFFEALAEPGRQSLDMRLSKHQMLCITLSGNDASG